MNKFRNPNYFHVLPVLFLIFFITGCLNTTNLPTEVPLIVSSTPVILPEQSPKPTPSSPITAVPTTIVPTLSAGNLNSYLAVISKNNGNCRFPCVWGFSPQMNTMNDLKIFMRNFGDVDVLNEYYIHSDISKDHASINFGVWENGIETDVSFRSMGNNEILYLFLTVIVPKTKQADYWKINQTSPFHVYYSNYLLSRILTIYGEPTKIFIGPEPEDDVPTRQTPWIPFGIVIFYPDQGFLVHYIMPKQIEGDFFRGCIKEVNEFTIIAWNPNLRKEISDIIRDVRPEYWSWMSEERLDEFYKPIEEIMPIEKFYEISKDPNHQDCINVPMSLWPYK